MANILALVNQKGGCGKTTTAIHLAAAFARRGMRCLLIDLDPQSHAAMGLGVEIPAEKPTLSEVLSRTALTGAGPDLDQAIVCARPGIHLVPANLGLAALEARLANVPGREERLSEHLAQIVDDWDVALIDSPPNLGLLTVNALVAADEALIPFEPATFALQGVERVLATIELVANQTEHRVTPRALPTMVPTHDLFASSLVHEFRDQHPGLVLPSRVRRSSLFPRAAAQGKSLGEVFPRAAAWRDYRNVADILARGWAESRPVTARFTGLRVVGQGVAFSHPELLPEDIQLAGSFNDWVPDRGVELRQLSNGGWMKFAVVPPGSYEYKFVVRGDWCNDPENPVCVPNDLGGTNSLIEVVPTPAVRAAEARKPAQA